jgi:hypothetical protein
VLFESREKGIDIMSVRIEDFPAYKNCLKRFFCGLLGLETEIFVEKPRCLC